MIFCRKKEQKFFLRMAFVGCPGCGKSTLIHRLLEGLHDSRCCWDAVTLGSNPAFSWNEYQMCRFRDKIGKDGIGLEEAIRREREEGDDAYRLLGVEDEENPLHLPRIPLGMVNHWFNGHKYNRFHKLFSLLGLELSLRTTVSCNLHFHDIPEEALTVRGMNRDVLNCFNAVQQIVWVINPLQCHKDAGEVSRPFADWQESFDIVKNTLESYARDLKKLPFVFLVDRADDSFGKLVMSGHSIREILVHDMGLDRLVSSVESLFLDVRYLMTNSATLDSYSACGLKTELCGDSPD